MKNELSVVEGLAAGLLGGHEQQIGSHPEADASRADGGEFWSEAKRDLMADLEGAAVAGGGDERDLRPEAVCGPELDPDLRPEEGRGKGGTGGEPTRKRQGEGKGLVREVEGRPGSVRGRPTEREADPQEPV